MKKCATSPADSLPDVLINKDTGIVVYFDMFCSYFFIVELVVRWSCYRVKFQAREGGCRVLFFCSSRALGSGFPRLLSVRWG